MSALILCIASPLANGALILDGSFEDPTLSPSGYVYAPSGTAWNYLSGSGITYLPSDWDHGRTAPDLNQVAFIQGSTATLSQTFSASAGSYTLSFIDAGRPNFGPYGGDTTYQVLVNNVVIQTLSTTSGQGFSLETFNISLLTGINSLEFRMISVNGAGHNGDDSAFIDKVSIVAVPEAGSVVAGALLLLPFGASTLRIMRRRNV